MAATRRCRSAVRKPTSTDVWLLARPIRRCRGPSRGALPPDRRPPDPARRRSGSRLAGDDASPVAPATRRGGDTPDGSSVGVTVGIGSGMSELSVGSLTESCSSRSVAPSANTTKRIRAFPHLRITNAPGARARPRAADDDVRDERRPETGGYPRSSRSIARARPELRRPGRASRPSRLRTSGAT